MRIVRPLSVLMELHHDSDRSLVLLLGCAPLAMRINLGTKIQIGTKRQAISRLSCGAGSQASSRVVEFPVGAGGDRGCYKPVTIIRGP